MTANQMIELMNRSPFEPLEIHLSDGNSIRVEHPYEIATKPNSAFCVVYAGDIARFVAIRNITEIITTPLNGS
ncbi:MAG TPA: hypothetical protein VFE46_10400 [Pirellulales bacterium]|jgi:hypothetical protein|nr:hypothetical protein [Pirellulales bacterium]